MFPNLFDKLLSAKRKRLSNVKSYLFQPRAFNTCHCFVLLCFRVFVKRNLSQINRLLNGLVKKTKEKNRRESYEKTCLRVTHYSVELNLPLIS